MKNKLSHLVKISGRLQARGYNQGDHFGLHGRQLEFVSGRGKVLFRVMADALRDADFERFEDDLP